MGSFTGFLYAQPSFVEGAARVVDFGDTLTEFNRSLDSEQADYLALLSDWETIGGDMYSAIDQGVQEIEEK